MKKIHWLYFTKPSFPYPVEVALTEQYHDSDQKAIPIFLYVCVTALSLMTLKKRLAEKLGVDLARLDRAWGDALYSIIFQEN